MRPLRGHVEETRGQYVGGADAAADDRGPGAQGSRVRPLGTAQAEFHDGVSFGGVNHPGCLGGNQTLMVDQIQKRRLHELRLDDGGADAQ